MLDLKFACRRHRLGGRGGCGPDYLKHVRLLPVVGVYHRGPVKYHLISREGGEDTDTLKWCKSLIGSSQVPKP